MTFPVPEAELSRYTSMSPQLLLEEAKKRIGKWHAPLPELLECTPLETIRGKESRGIRGVVRWGLERRDKRACDEKI